MTNNTFSSQVFLTDSVEENSQDSISCMRGGTCQVANIVVVVVVAVVVVGCGHGDGGSAGECGSSGEFGGYCGVGGGGCDGIDGDECGRGVGVGGGSGGGGSGDGCFGVGLLRAVFCIGVGGACGQGLRNMEAMG